MNKYVERLYNGIIKENPTFVLMLGMCPTLAVTSSAINGLGMGLSTTVVLESSVWLTVLSANTLPTIELIIKLVTNKLLANPLFFISHTPSVYL